MSDRKQTISGDVVLNHILELDTRMELIVEGHRVKATKICVINTDIPSDRGTVWTVIGYGYVVDSQGYANGVAFYGTYTGNDADWNCQGNYQATVSFEISEWRFSKFDNGFYFSDVEGLYLPRILGFYPSKSVNGTTVTFDYNYSNVPVVKTVYVDMEVIKEVPKWNLEHVTAGRIIAFGLFILYPIFMLIDSFVNR